MNPQPNPDSSGGDGSYARVKLRLLGGAVLERDGAVVTGRASQRRRVALLSLLALAPGRTLSRDRIVGYLWPEYDTDQARHLLAGAVYDLRRSLAEGTVVSRGDDIELGPVVATDVDEFAAAADAGDWDRAMTCYAGPFLDGFHISDAPGFEQWVDAERQQLERRFAAVLEAAARDRAAAGDVVAATALWRRLAVLEPYNSRIARELMLALDAAGDRAGAIQHARTHTLLLREEFGAEPDAAIEALAERLRAGNGAPAPPAGPVPVTDPEAAPRPAEPAPPAAVVAPPGTVEAAPAAAGGPPSPASPASAGPPQAGAGAAGTSEPERAVSPTPAWARLQSWVPRLWPAVAILLLAVAGWLLVGPGRGEDAAEPAPSIAVLPFRAIGVPDEHAMLGEGLSEEIISSLSRLDGLRVAARTSSFTFRDGTDVRDVGRRLRVSHLLEGAVRGGADRLQVTARLVDTGSGYEVWTRQFVVDWAMQDILEVQEQIAQAVVAAMEPELPGRRASGTRLVAGSTVNLDAFNEYSTGRHYFHRRTVDDMRTATRHFLRAVQHDPAYALAHAALAETYALLGAYDYGAVQPHMAYEAARSAAERALALAPDLAEAQTAMASVHFNFDWDWDAAERAFLRALDRNRGYAPAHHWLSLLYAARGRSREANAAMLRAAELDPLSPVMQSGVARHYYFARDNVRAAEQYRRVLAMDSTFVTARIGLGLTLIQLGRVDAAIAEFQHAERLLGMTAPVLHGLLGFAHGLAGDRAAARMHLAALDATRASMYFPAEYTALIHIGLGDLDGAFASLELALENQSGGLAYLAVEPMIDRLRPDPRYRKLLERVGL